MIRLRDITVAACVVLASAGGTPSDASTNDRVERSVAVSFAELDLSKEAGVSELNSRLQRAAEKVCGLARPSSGSLTTRSSTLEKEQCYNDAIARAIAQLDLPLLEARHSG
jgi:UrcA family protein